MASVVVLDTILRELRGFFLFGESYYVISTTAR